jgi:hypothetical protein
VQQVGNYESQLIKKETTYTIVQFLLLSSNQVPTQKYIKINHFISKHIYEHIGNDHLANILIIFPIKFRIKRIVIKSIILFYSYGSFDDT